MPGSSIALCDPLLQDTVPRRNVRNVISAVPPISFVVSFLLGSVRFPHEHRDEIDAREALIGMADEVGNATPSAPIGNSTVPVTTEDGFLASSASIVRPTNANAETSLAQSRTQLVTVQFSWTQTTALRDGGSGGEVVVSVPVPNGTSSKMVEVTIKRYWLSVSLKGDRPLVAGNLWEEVRLSGSVWHMQEEDGQKLVEVILEKQNRTVCWDNIFGAPSPVHDELWRTRVDTQVSDLENYTRQIHSLSGMSKWQKAVELFHGMPEKELVPHVFAYNALLRAYEKSEHPERSLEEFEAMQQQAVIPNQMTYTTLMSALEKGTDPGKVLQAFEAMQRQALVPDLLAYSALISAYGKSPEPEKALEVYERMQQQGVVPDLIVCSAVVSACERCEQSERAPEVFQQMQRQGVMPDSVVLNYSASDGDKPMEWNFETFKMLQCRGVLRDQSTWATYCTQIRACSELNRSKAYFDYVRGNIPGLPEPELPVVRNESQLEAQRLFKQAVAAEKNGNRDEAMSLYGKAYGLWPELEVDSDSEPDELDEQDGVHHNDVDGEDSLPEMQPLLSRLFLEYAGANDTAWWQHEASILEIGRLLSMQSVVCIDSFVDQACVNDVRKEIVQARAEGFLLGKMTGDITLWANYKKDDGWSSLKTLVDRIDGLLRRIKADGVVGLENVTSRELPMVACHPGNGARSRLRFDNNCSEGEGDCCNGRRLAAVVYLNPGWQPSHGGALRIFNANRSNLSKHVDGSIKGSIAPIAGRLVLYWSDFRVPYEVRPSRAERYAVTLWYLDCVEKARTTRLPNPW